jgi:hypothetical protein
MKKIISKWLKQMWTKMYFRHLELKAQYTLYALFMTVISLITYTVAVYPILDEILTEAAIGGVEGTILSYSPLFVLLFVLWGGLWYVNPHKRNE